MCLSLCLWACGWVCAGACVCDLYHLIDSALRLWCKLACFTADVSWVLMPASCRQQAKRVKAGQNHVPILFREIFTLIKGFTIAIDYLAIHIYLGIHSSTPCVLPVLLFEVTSLHWPYTTYSASLTWEIFSCFIKSPWVLFLKMIYCLNCECTSP